MAVLSSRHFLAAALALSALACSNARDGATEPPLEHATAPLVVAPEFPIGGPIALANPGDEFRPAVASDGTNFLVAWTEAQKGLAFKRYDGATGQPFDADAVRLNFGDFSAAAYGGGKFAIVANYAGALIATLINQDGSVATPTFTLVASGTILPGQAQFHPAIAWTGHNFLVLPDPTITYGVRFSTTGQILDPTPKQGFSPAVGGTPRIACGPTNCLVVDVNGIGKTFGLLVDPVAMTSKPVADSLLNGCGDDVVWDGGAYTAVGVGVLPSSALRGMRIDATGAVVTPPKDLATGGAFLVRVRVAGSGSTLVVSDRGTLYRVDTATLTVIGTTTSLTGSLPNVDTADIAAPVLAGGNYLLLWDQLSRATNTRDIYGRRMALDGTLPESDAVFLSGMTNSQLAPALAFDGTNYLAAWADQRPSMGTRVYFARVTPDGTVLDPSGIATAITDLGLETSRLALGYAGGVYLLCETGFCRRMMPSGEMVGDIFYGGGEDNVIAFDGTQWIAASNNSTGPSASQGVYVQSISLDGITVSPKVRVFSTAALARSLSIASGATGEAVLGFTALGVAGVRMRVRPDGTILEPATRPCSACSADYPGVGFGGGQYLFSWTMGSGSTADIVAARYKAGVQLDTGTPLVGSGGLRNRSSVAFMGTRFLVAWYDQSVGYDGAANSDLYGGRITAAGTAAPGNNFVIANSRMNETDLVMAGGNGQALVAFTRAYANGNRLFGRIVTDDVGCVNASECPDDGLACTQATCTNGTCGQAITATSCLVAGVCYASGAADPSGACAACRPTTSQTTFTPVACGMGGSSGSGGSGAGGSGSGGSGSGGSGAGGATGSGGTSGSGGATGSGGRAGSGGATGGRAGSGGATGAGGSQAAGGSVGSGAGGSQGAGGALATGGGNGTAGAPGSGGAGTGSGGAAATDAGTETSSGGTTPSNGCGCATAPAPPHEGLAALAALPLVALIARRRGRRR